MYEPYCADVHILLLVVLLLFVNNSRTEIHKTPTNALVADTRSQKENGRIDGHGWREVLSAPYRRVTNQFHYKVTNI